MRPININKIIKALRDYKKTNKKYPEGRFKLTKTGKITNASAGNKDGFNLKRKKKPKKPKKPKKDK